VNRFAHSQLISVLNGDSTLVPATDGQVVPNLIPLLNDVLHSLTPLAFACALAASPRQRRALLQLSTGGTTTLVVILTAFSWLRSSLTTRRDPRYQAATSPAASQRRIADAASCQDAAVFPL
jgi:hypothetical protein